MIAATLATIHNESFVVRLVDQMRAALKTGHFFDLKDEFMGRFKHKSGQHHDWLNLYLNRKLTLSGDDYRATVFKLMHANSVIKGATQLGWVNNRMWFTI